MLNTPAHKGRSDQTIQFFKFNRSLWFDYCPKQYHDSHAAPFVYLHFSLDIIICFYQLTNLLQLPHKPPEVRKPPFRKLWITSICDHWNMYSFCGVLGGTVPPDTTLVFDLVLLDIFNRADQVQTKVISTPKDCKRSVMRTDFVRFHFNASLLDGTVFDSRLVLLHVPVTSNNNDCFQTSFLNTPVLNSHSSLSNVLLVQPPANRERSQNSFKVLVTKLVWSLIRFSKM